MKKIRVKRKRKPGSAENVKVRLDQVDEVLATIINSVNEWSQRVEAKILAIEDKLDISQDAEQAEDCQEGTGE